MFQIAEFTDTVKIDPSRFAPRVDSSKAIIDGLRQKYVSKVYPDLGLVVAFYALKNIGDAFIYPGDGSAQVSVCFQLVLFRPFIGEVLVGKVASCSRKAGVKVSIGFFHEITIPPTQLQPHSHYDEAEKVFVWKFQTEEGGATHDLFMDIGEEIRLKVHSLKFKEPAPISRDAQGTDASEHQAPFSIIGSITEDGLGLVSWWTTEE